MGLWIFSELHGSSGWEPTFLAGKAAWRLLGEEARLPPVLHPVLRRRRSPQVPSPLKAVFSITLIHPAGTVGLSNSLEQGQVREREHHHALTEAAPAPSLIHPSWSCLCLCVPEAVNTTLDGDQV